jgi:long-chain acyl-CoA synthetase
MDAVWSLLADTCRHHGDREALVHGEERWSWNELLARSEELAARLADSGLKQGDRVALLWENSPRYVQIYFALMRLGAVLVALNPVTEEHYVNRVLADCRPHLLVAQSKFLRRFAAGLDPELLPSRLLLEEELDLDEFAPGAERMRIEEAAELRLPEDLPLPDPRDLAMILYTSGTTGAPKGVCLSQRNLLTNTESIVGYLGLDESERVLVLLPFYYSYGHSVLLSHVAVGGCLVIDNRFGFPNTVLDTALAEKVTGLPGVASTFNILMLRSRLPETGLPDLRYFTTAGGALPPAGFARLRAMLPEATPFPMYGQTEGTARLSYLPPEELDRKAGSIGRGIPGVELAVLDKAGSPVAPGETGEIVAAGENIMSGYWEDPEETARVLDEQGRLWTGDLARVDEEGYIFVVGREKEMIKSGAFRINPKEIEEILDELEGVLACAVVGLPDELLGEKMLVCLVPVEGTLLEEKTVMRHLKRRLPHWKVPQGLRFFDALPRTASGKIRKHRLREALMEP